MKSKTLLIVILWCACFGSAISTLRADEVYIPTKYKGVILSAPGIVNYSNSGLHGVYRLTINSKDGTVDSIGVLKKAERHLDADAVITFMKWKFRPGAIKEIDVPVTFDRQATILLKDAASR